MAAAASLFCRLTTITMNKAVIQYRNKAISHYHDHAHDHVHLHGPGDLASLLIAVIVMVGVIIAVIAVACLVSNKKAISLGAGKHGGGAEVCVQHSLSSAYISFFILGVGVAVLQPVTDLRGRVPEQFP